MRAFHRRELVFALQVETADSLLRAEAESGAMLDRVLVGDEDWRIWTDHGSVPGRWGDYIVVDPAGKWRVVTRQAFMTKYAPAADEPRPPQPGGGRA